MTAENKDVHVKIKKTTFEKIQQKVKEDYPRVKNVSEVLRPLIEASFGD